MPSDLALTPGDIGLFQGRVLPPSRILLAGTITALLLSLCCIMLAHRQPYLGLRATGLNIAPRGFGKQPGASTRLTISESSGHSMAILDSDLVPEPDIAFHDYATFNRFLWRQDQLAQLTRRPQIEITRPDGRRIHIQPLPRRPFLYLPLLFWYQLLVGIGCWLCGLAIWAFRRSEPAAIYCALSSFGILLLTDSAAVYSTRELALPGTTFRTLSTINHFGSMLACGAFIAVLCITQSGSAALMRARGW